MVVRLPLRILRNSTSIITLLLLTWTYKDLPPRARVAYDHIAQGLDALLVISFPILILVNLWVGKGGGVVC